MAATRSGRCQRMTQVRTAFRCLPAPGRKLQLSFGILFLIFFTEDDFLGAYSVLTVNYLWIVFPQRFHDCRQLLEKLVVSHVARQQVRVGLVNVIVDEPTEQFLCGPREDLPVELVTDLESFNLQVGLYRI